MTNNIAPSQVTLQFLMSCLLRPHTVQNWWNKYHL